MLSVLTNKMYFEVYSQDILQVVTNFLKICRAEGDSEVISADFKYPDIKQ